MYSLQTVLDITVTTALTAQTYSVGAIPENACGLAIESIFTYGSGGTNGKAWVQTSLDGGTTWFDIACFAVTTATKPRIVNLSARTPVTTLYTPTDGTLGDDTVKDGILGNMLRVKVTTTGTYAGSTTWKIYVQPKP